ncbi:MAG: alkaline phosphatase [Myxococcota bacterium]
MRWWVAALGLAVGVAGCGKGDEAVDAAADTPIVWFDVTGQDAPVERCLGVKPTDPDGRIDARWWSGDPTLLGSLPLTGLEDGCVLKADAPWLALSLAGETLEVRLADTAIPSGVRDVQVVVSGAVSGQSLFIINLRLSVLNRAPASATRHVVVFGLDGFRPDAIAVANTPTLDRLLAHGASTLKATTQLTGATRSGPGWASILTGVEVAKHGVTTNDAADIKTDPAHPTFLERARLAGLASEIIFVWVPLIGMVEPEVTRRLASEEQLAGLAAASIDGGPPNLLFMHFDALDHAGHAEGYGGAVPAYVTALEETDARIGAVIDAVIARPSVANEEWLFVVVTDHSGEGTDHGPTEPIYRTIPLIFAGPRVPAAAIDGASHMDVYPTALAFLGLEPEAAWDLDGQVRFRAMTDTAAAPAATE